MNESQLLLNEIARLGGSRTEPLMVAIDGRSGTGKSTLAETVRRRLEAIVIDGDDFYAGGTAEEWDAMTPAQRADHCIDWRRQRPILAELARGEGASWLPYDWNADDGHLSDDLTVAHPAPVVVLEGVYSARPELADLFQLRTLLEVPDDLRRERLLHREGEFYRDEWEQRWASAEEHYFTSVMPAEAFDLVLRP